jgi:hypothetical protein
MAFMLEECYNGDLGGINILPYLDLGKRKPFYEWKCKDQLETTIVFAKIALRVDQTKRDGELVQIPRKIH